MERFYQIEKVKMLKEVSQLRENFQEMWGEQKFKELFNQTIDEFIADTIKKSDAILKNRFIKPPPDNEATHIWIGINPPLETFTLTSLYETTIEALAKYKALDKACFVVEANTNNGYRPHIHLMAITNTKPYRIIEQLAKHYNLNNQSIECKAYHKGLLYKEHLDYINGIKTTEKKDLVELDIKEREDLGIPHIIKSKNFDENKISP
jgi:hypothetical protein